MILNFQYGYYLSFFIFLSLSFLKKFTDIKITNADNRILEYRNKHLQILKFWNRHLQ